MRHCCKFKPEDIYYLKDTDLFSSRYLTIGFCPICNIPAAELVERRFDGYIQKTELFGLEANNLLISKKDEIVYSLKQLNYKKSKSKPFGWIYGINKTVKSGGRNVLRQYACDFYGNKELVRSYK